MSDHDVLDIWSTSGRIGRGRYLFTGLVLLGVKHNFDRLLAYLFGYPWGPFNYWIFNKGEDITHLSGRDENFYAVLVFFALPFIWAGTVLTLRRLRDADWPLWLVVIFFIPFLNVIFFLLLSAVPSTEAGDRRSHLAARIGRFIPKSEFGSAVFGILATA